MLAKPICQLQEWRSRLHRALVCHRKREMRTWNKRIERFRQAAQKSEQRRRLGRDAEKGVRRKLSCEILPQRDALSESGLGNEQHDAIVLEGIEHVRDAFPFDPPPAHLPPGSAEQALHPV